jgi:hypothetical protein
MAICEVELVSVMTSISDDRIPGSHSMRVFRIWIGLNVISDLKERKAIKDLHLIAIWTISLLC